MLTSSAADRRRRKEVVMTQIDERTMALAVRSAEERIQAHQHRASELRRAKDARATTTVRWFFLGLGW